jgi:hypothetical protein
MKPPGDYLSPLLLGILLILSDFWTLPLILGIALVTNIAVQNFPAPANSEKVHGK